MSERQVQRWTGLKGKRVLITGASSGLGAFFSRILASHGARVAVAARRITECERVCSEIGDLGEAIPVSLDVTQAASAVDAVNSILEAWGGLDIVVNNAGTAGTCPLVEETEASWDRIIDTNLKGAFLVGQAAARVMTGGGSIVNVASILGLRVANQLGAYGASKAGLIQLTRTMALEWARNDIRVNALCPGYVETDLNRDFFATEAGRALIRRIPQKRLGTLSDVAGPLLFLCSDDSRYVTGTSLVADGGHLVSSL
jgi:NAD(P)-dependent dehydrogenase (short-subunit alcohol dehydrogenase family)